MCGVVPTEMKLTPAQHGRCAVAAATKRSICFACEPSCGGLPPSAREKLGDQLECAAKAPLGSIQPTRHQSAVRRTANQPAQRAHCAPATTTLTARHSRRSSRPNAQHCRAVVSAAPAKRQLRDLPVLHAHRLRAVHQLRRQAQVWRPRCTRAPRFTASTRLRCPIPHDAPAPAPSPRRYPQAVVHVPEMHQPVSGGRAVVATL